MKLSDLKTGMIVTLRNGNEYVVLKDYCVSDETAIFDKGIICNVESSSWTRLSNFNEKMECTNTIFGKEYDIVRVEVPAHPFSIQKPSYEKDKRTILYDGIVKEVTMAEIEKKFGCKVKIVKED